MSFDAQKLFSLLPPLHRMRDLALGAALQTPSAGVLDLERRSRFIGLQTKERSGQVLSDSEKTELASLAQKAIAGPLASLLAVLAEQIGLIEEDLDQLYDDQFIETCAEWVIPYIGDLVGYRMLHGAGTEISSPRAEVAHTIAFRRRKGTLSVLERLAHDVTGWNVKAVEFFQLLVTTQYMNHRRPGNLATPDLRRWAPLERVGSAFDSIARTVDVRRIARGRGRYNIPNIGLFLYRIEACSLSSSPAVPVDARRFRFHPLGIDQPLYTGPESDDDTTRLAGLLNVPTPLSRRTLDANLAGYYSDGKVKRSLCLYTNESGTFQPVPSDEICVCHLGDHAGSWAHLPPDGKYAVDPELGRLALPDGLPDGTQVKVDFHYGGSANIGGGEYARVFDDDPNAPPPVLVPTDSPTIAGALAALGGSGIVEIEDSGRYVETLNVAAPANGHVQIRAASGHRPTLVLSGELVLTGGPGSEIVLDGLLVTGQSVRVPQANNSLARLRIRHSTLVPGLARLPDMSPASAQTASFIVERSDAEVTIESSILGAVRVESTSTLSATDSMIDATDAAGVAYAATDDAGPGGALTLNACTVVGKVHALSLPLVTNTMIVAELGTTNESWTAPVIGVRRQQGCVRFSYVPKAARVPRRYRCLPESGSVPEVVRPVFASLRYGDAAYGQLASASGDDLLAGADDEGQPGVYHSLFQPQRETNLRVRLAEYLRVGLEAGVFYES